MPETLPPAAAENYSHPIRLCWYQLCCLAVELCQEMLFGQDFGQQPVTSEAVLWSPKQACCAAKVSTVSKALTIFLGSCMNAIAITLETM